MLAPPIAPPEEKPSSVIRAADAFQSPQEQKAQPVMPSFTKQELFDLGVTLVESDKVRLLTIPYEAQKHMLVAVKDFAFGAPKALDAILKQILHLFEFKGQVAFHTPANTFDLCATQTLSPKGVAGSTPPPAPPLDSSISSECPPRLVPKLIGLVGLRRAGKDTAAEALVEDGYQNVKFAGALKEMSYAFLLYRGANLATAERLIDGDLKEVPSNWFDGRSPRYFMQRLGTEFGRDLISQELWVNTCLDRAKQYERAVISDVRFYNEADALHKLGGKLIRIVRPGGTVDGHVSESSIAALQTDFEILNDGSVQDLHNKVRELVATI